MSNPDARPAQVVCLGLDAADKDLILEWAAAGALPTLSRLLTTSAHGVMTTPPGHCAGSVWPTFTTSVNPARHGRYFLKQLRRGSYDYDFFKPQDLKSPPFWQLLDDQGVRIALVDVPKAPLAQHFSGTQVLDWGTHDPESDTVRCYPATRGAEITARYGKDPVGRCDHASRDASGMRRLSEQLCNRALTRGRLIRDTIASGDNDLVIGVFSESHCAGHQFWHLHDAQHPDHDAAIAQETGNPLQQVYIAIDRAIGEILDSLDPETQVVVFTSHGIGPHFDATYLLREVLERLQASGTDGKLATVNLLRKAWGLLPRGFRRRIRREAPQIINRTEAVALKDLDFFRVPTNDNCGGIRINLKGREPDGQVEPGAHYERVIEQLISDLHELKNAETGEAVVKQVLRSDQLFEGPYLNDLPDLNVVWNTCSPIRAVSSPRTGTVSDSYYGRRTGDHREFGYLWIQGPDARPGPLGRQPAIMDVGPTLAALLECELPNVEGVPALDAE